MYTLYVYPLSFMTFSHWDYETLCECAEVEALKSLNMKVHHIGGYQILILLHTSGYAPSI